jgi:hypothetical protein
VLKPELVGPDIILPEGDPAHGHARVMEGWYLIYTSSDERSPFSQYSAHDQLLAAVRELVARCTMARASVSCARGTASARR